jgi:hypothetical protein
LNPNRQKKKKKKTEFATEKEKRGQKQPRNNRSVLVETQGNSKHVRTRPIVCGEVGIVAIVLIRVDT